MEKALISAPKNMQGKTLHRCPNPKCDALFEEPAKEITYVTEPPTERLICPKCFTPLRELATGKLKIGQFEEVVEEEEKPTLYRYDLTVEPTKLAEVMALLSSKGYTPLPVARGGEIHLSIVSEKELSFRKLKRERKNIGLEKGIGVETMSPQKWSLRK